jgi:hypothetical protein
MSHGRAARFGALPSPSHHHNKTSLPCCVRIRTKPGGTSEAALRVILGKTRRERPAGDGGALRSEG